MRTLLVLASLASCFGYSFSHKAKHDSGSSSSSSPSSSSSSSVQSSSVASSSSSSTSAPYDDSFERMVAGSACAKTSWSGRGTAPVGFVKGLALTYGRSICRYRAGEAVGTYLAGAPHGDLDVLSWYASKLPAAGVTVDTPEKRIRALYTIAFGFGMRESSGMYCEGRDMSATNTTSATAEAGIFQTSWNAIGSGAIVRQGLVTEYLNKPGKCMLDVFSQETQTTNPRGSFYCSPANFQNYGSGDGLIFQKLSKSCPAFATEFAMVTARVLRNHYGPLSRREAQVNASCWALLGEVDKVLTPEACAVLK